MATAAAALVSHCTNLPPLLPRHNFARTPPSQWVSGFSGKKLKLFQNELSHYARTSRFLLRAQLNKNVNHGNFAHDMIESGEHVLDDISHWIQKKVGERLSAHLPEDFEILDWIPKGMQSRIHSVERAATIFVRECLLLGIFYFLFKKVEKSCRWLHNVQRSKTGRGDKATDAEFHASAFHAMIDPIRAGLVLWESTRIVFLAGPLIKLRLGLQMVQKARAVGFIVILTWFLFRWKNLTLERLISKNRSDLPRLIAFDKVLSLLMYYIAGACIGEVAGFALRSVLAIGGVSGIAVGFAAKEIVGNFLGGTLLFITRPFVIGDLVKAQSFEGEVEDIDFLHTKLIGHDKSPVLVPNEALLKEVIVNYSRTRCRLLSAVFQLRSEDIFVVDKLTAEIIEYLHNHPKVDKEKQFPICYLKAMNANGLDIELLCFVTEKENVRFYKLKQELLVNAAHIIRKEGGSLQMPPQITLAQNFGSVDVESGTTHTLLQQ